MSLANIINEDLIYANINYSSKEDFFKYAHSNLYNLGYVTEEFNEKILQREVDFPTAINMGNYGVAIPHTDSKYVRKEFISVYTFKQPLILKAMENKKEDVYVRVAFILGFSESHNSLGTLKELMNLIRNESSLEAMINVSSSREVLDIINNKCLEW